MLYALSQVEDSKLEKIKALEIDSGVRLLALSELDVAPAKLDGEALDAIKALEGELGLTLVAVN